MDRRTIELAKLIESAERGMKPLDTVRLLALILLCLLAHPLSGQNPVASDTIILDKGWTFCRTDKKKEVRPATVPGVVQQDLIQQGILPNPHYRSGEDSVQWIENHDWSYALDLRLRSEQIEQHAAVRLVCEGLDTYARLYVNGREVGESNNMFVPLSLDIKPWLRPGINRIEIVFRSPISEHLVRIKETGYQYPADNDHHKQRVSVYTRKAPYHFGWDWGMRMLTIGPWRPVYLIFEGDVALDGSIDCAYALNASLDRATLSIQNPLVVHKNHSPLTQMIRLYAPEGKVLREYKQIICDSIPPSTSISFEDIPVNLWYPRGYGQQPLYTIELSITRHDGHPLLYSSQQIGFRKVKLVRKQDDYGQTFFFEINDLPVFAKGANYIPTTHLLATRTPASLIQLWDRIEEQNLNMIRVWGGGIYEDNDFYREADRRGILIWQDWMFACTAYPANGDFLANIHREVRTTVRRIGHHPSIIAWCGNNEIKEGLRYWGWQHKYTPKQYEGFVSDYNKIFCQVIPQALDLSDQNNRPYIESSPDTANWGKPSSLAWGESHYWGVWYGREPFESFSRRIPRFMSEFGIQSLPDMVSIRKFTLPQDRNLASPVMKLHQKSSTGNEVISDYICTYYRSPKDFADMTYLSQLTQARGIAYGIRAQRAARPYCMGSLYWQLGDVWPALSWSSIDYYGRPKALHYEARRAFDPLALFVDTERFDPKNSLKKEVRQPNTIQTLAQIDSIYISFINDSCALTDLSLQIIPLTKILCADGEQRYVSAQSHEVRQIQIEAQTVHRISIPLQHFVRKEDLPHTMLSISLRGTGGERLASTLFCPLPPKDMTNEISTPCIQTDLSQNLTQKDLWILCIQSENPVLGLAIEPEEGQEWIPNDNYIDLMPHEPFVLTIRSIEKPRFILRHL